MKDNKSKGIDGVVLFLLIIMLCMSPFVIAIPIQRPSRMDDGGYHVLVFGLITLAQKK